MKSLPWHFLQSTTKDFLAKIKIKVQIYLDIYNLEPPIIRPS